MIKQLSKMTYQGIVDSEDPFVNYEERTPDHTHFYRYSHKDDRFAYLICPSCGVTRAIINPLYLPYYLKKKKEEMLEKQARKAASPGKLYLGSVDRDLARKSLDKYEGSADDFLQPYNSDGTRNEKFVKKYGTKIYKTISKINSSDVQS